MVPRTGTAEPTEVERETGVLCGQCKINVRNGSQHKKEANAKFGFDICLKWVKKESVRDRGETPCYPEKSGNKVRHVNVTTKLPKVYPCAVAGSTPCQSAALQETKKGLLDVENLHSTFSRVINHCRHSES